MSFLMIVHVPNESVKDPILSTNKNDSIETLETDNKSSLSAEEDTTESGPKETDETAEKSQPSDISEQGDTLSTGATESKNEQLPDSGEQKEAGDATKSNTATEETDNGAGEDQKSLAVTSPTEGESEGQGDGSVTHLIKETEVPEINHVDLGEIKTDDKAKHDNEVLDSADPGEDAGEVTQDTSTMDDAEKNPSEQLPVMTPNTLKNLVPLVVKTPLHQEVEHLLVTEGKVINLEKAVVGEGKFIRFSFIEDDSKQCENILNMLKAIGVGFTADTSISVFPSSVHESGAGQLDSSTASEKSLEDLEGKDEIQQETQKESVFKKSIKSRLVVAQVVASVRGNALFTFDYLLLLLLASFIACVGLAESSSVVLVASMLISPLMLNPMVVRRRVVNPLPPRVLTILKTMGLKMLSVKEKMLGPILAGTFGQVVKMKDLRNLGVRSELMGLSLCLLVGFIFGLITGGIGLQGAIWGSSDQWPTPEMKSRGMLRSLWVGVLIALPSGAGVAISVLSANAGSLVGVAISASLLPPACNAGMLWGYSLLAAIRPPEIENSGIPSMLSTTIPPTTSVFPNNITLQNLSYNISNTTDLPHSSQDVEPPRTTVCLPLVNNAYRPVYSCDLAIDAAILGLVSLFLTILNIFCIFIVGILFLKIKEVAPHTAGKEKATDHFWHEDVKVARTYYETSKGATSTQLGKQFLEEWKKVKIENPLEKGEDARKDSMTEKAETLEMCQYLTDIQNSLDMQNVLSKLNTPTEDLMEDLKPEFEEARVRLHEEILKHPGFVLSNAVIKGQDKKFMRAYHTLSEATPEVKKPSIFEMRKRFRKMGGVQSMYIETRDETAPASSFLASPAESSLGKRRRERKAKAVKFDVQRVDEDEEECLIIP